MVSQGGAKALVLCYHAVSATWPAPLFVTPEQFRMQVDGCSSAATGRSRSAPPHR